MKKERTCIGCNGKGEKTELHRIVRTCDGKVLFDPTGQAAGRGAYVCSLGCLDTVRRSGRLASSLRCRVPEDSFDEIRVALAARIPSREGNEE